MLCVSQVRWDKNRRQTHIPRL